MCDSATTDAVVNGLKPYTMFRFAVRSHAGSVVGPFSEEVHCRTAQGREYWYSMLLLYSP